MGWLLVVWLIVSSIEWLVGCWLLVEGWLVGWLPVHLMVVCCLCFVC